MWASLLTFLLLALRESAGWKLPDFPELNPLAKLKEMRSSYNDFCETSPDTALCPHKYYQLFTGPCPVRRDAGARLAELAGEQFFGQALVVPRIVDMLDYYVDQHQQQRPTRRLISFHIAGDNGVGKTFMADLIAQALYRTPRSGFLSLSGSNFRGSNPETVRRHRETLFNLVVAQLERCPRSFIVLDEMQYVHADTLNVLQQFMDNTDYIVKSDGKKVLINEAILGFISDFGTEGRTQNMSFEDLEQMVVQELRLAWQTDPKQVSLIQRTFPFTSLTDDDIENIARHFIANKFPAEHFDGRVRNVTVSDAVVKFAATKIRKAYNAENGRGASKWLVNRLLPDFKAHFRQAAAQRPTETVFDARVSFRNDRPHFEFSPVVARRTDKSEL